MSTVTVSPKYQIVIPKEICETLHIKPGQKLEVLEFEGCLEFMPIKDIRSLRGSLKGMDTPSIREKKDRL